MRNPKMCAWALLVCLLMSCKKQSELIIQNKPESAASDVLSGEASKNLPTCFGLMLAYGSVDSVQAHINKAGIRLIRVPLVLSETTTGNVINQHLAEGYNVQVNLNWSTPAGGPAPFPKNEVQIKKQAETFFKNYAYYINQIPLVVVENEWDNIAYHSGKIQDYLYELAIITDVAHKYGFKIADAGLSSVNLRRWVYTQLSGDEAEQWKKKYCAGGLTNASAAQLNKNISAYIAGIKNIPVDYINVHWYNISECYNGFKQATQIYMNACSKNTIVCNEFGIKTNSENLFQQTIDEIKGNATFALAYSGLGEKNKAVRLTDEMLALFNR